MPRPGRITHSNTKRPRSFAHCRSQTTGWTYNSQHPPASARYTETNSGITSPASTFGFIYDALGKLTQFTQFTQFIAGGKLEAGKLTRYNANGAFVEGSSTTGETVKHSYTPRGQLATSITTHAVPSTLATATKPATPFIPAKTALTIFTYDAIGQSKPITYPNGDWLVFT